MPLWVWPVVAPIAVFALDDAHIDPRLDRDDRQQHAAAGFVIGAVSRAVIERGAPQRPWWQKQVAATAVAAVAGVAREVADANRSDHSSEVGDVVATAIGGAAGVILIDLTFRF